MYIIYMLYKTQKKKKTYIIMEGGERKNRATYNMS